jgi:hypothetical protein
MDALGAADGDPPYASGVLPRRTDARSVPGKISAIRAGGRLFWIPSDRNTRFAPELAFFLVQKSKILLKN